jgi:hypothetical protein
MRCPERELWAWVALAALWRVLLAALTPLPSEDGVNYLWMAERFAQGDAAGALGEVFPPLLSLLTAVPIALGLEPFGAGQLVLALAGAIAVVPSVRLVEHCVPGHGRAAALFAALLPLPARFAAEIYSEPLFVLLGAAALLASVRARWVACGLLIGAAFWVRPEALLIAVALLLARGRRAWPAAALALAAVALLALARGLLGAGFDPLPKLAFNQDKSILGNDGLGAVLLAFLANLARLPWLWIEAFALAGVLALLGLVRGPQPRVLLVLLALALVLIAAFVPRRRFLVSWTFAMLPLALAGLAAVPARARTIAIALVAASSVALGLRVTDADRGAERDVGAFLGARLGAHQTLAGDMTRVLYYAGRRPLPPRHFAAADIVAAARDPAVRFVVLGARRPAAAVVERELADAFGVLRLPEPLRAAAAARGIAVLERR